MENNINATLAAPMGSYREFFLECNYSAGFGFDATPRCLFDNKSYRVQSEEEENNKGFKMRTFLANEF